MVHSNLKALLLPVFLLAPTTAFMVKLLIKNSGVPLAVCTRWVSYLPPELITIYFRSAGLFLYDLGSLYCSGVRHAKVHNGAYDANCSRGFGITLGNCIVASLDLKVSFSRLLVPLFITSVARAGTNPVVTVADPLLINVDSSLPKLTPPSGLITSTIALPISLIAILDS